MPLRLLPCLRRRCSNGNRTKSRRENGRDFIKLGWLLVPTIALGGVRLFYEERGNGIPLYCVPGGLGTGETDFGPQLDTWSARFHVISPDLRGYGRSRPPMRDFGPSMLERDAEDIIALTQALGHESFFLAGWSDGANAAVVVAATRPDIVRRLVIWGGNSYLGSDEINALAQARSLSSWPRRRRQAFETVYGDSLEALWTSYCDSMNDQYASGGDICRDYLSRIRCKTLVLHGDLDPLVSEHQASVMHQGISGSHLHVIQGGRHSIHLSHADEFNEAMFRFLME